MILCCSLLLKISAVMSTVQTLIGRSYCLGTSTLLVLIQVDTSVKTPAVSQTT